MSRSGDSDLDPTQLATVKLHAERLLHEASAISVFPTPIDKLMDAAKLTVVDDAFLDEGVLQQFLRRAKAGYGTIKSALSKVLGLIHVPERLVLIDKAMPAPKLPFVKLHEAGHGSLPHQAAMYTLIQDCEKTLHPDIEDLFEREANAFASEVLFQGDRFAEEARHLPFGMKASMDLATKYGASKYSAFRRYVSTNHSACCVIVLEPVVRSDSGGGFTAQIRRIVCSKTFSKIFDPLAFGNQFSNAHHLGHLVPVGKKMTKARSIKITDRNGDVRNCIGEAFDSTHQIFVLIEDKGVASSRILIAAGSTRLS